MAAYIALEKQSCWYMKDESIGRTAASFILAELEGPAASSVRNKLQKDLQPSLAWGEFREAGPEEVQTLLRAVQRTRERMEREGRPANWPHAARQFRRLVAALGELLEYLGADPRVTGERQSCRQRLRGRRFKHVYFYKPDGSGMPLPVREKLIAIGEAMTMGCGAVILLPLVLAIVVALVIGVVVGLVWLIGWLVRG